MTFYLNIPFNPAIWIDLPAVYPRDAPDPIAWGAVMATACWSDSGQPFRQEDVDRLAEVLTSLVTKLGPGALHPEQEFDPQMEIQTLLHLPDPRVLPIPVRAMVFHERVVRSEKLTLADLVQIEDAEAIDEPEVVDFEHPNLGIGLRAFRHRASDLEDDAASAVFAVLKYAFPVPDREDLVFVSLSWPDLARIATARRDIDEVVRSIEIEYHPDPPAETGADA